MKEFNDTLLKSAVFEFLRARNRSAITEEGLKDTPDRVVKMINEVLEGEKYSNHEIAEMFNKCFSAPSDDLVVIKNVDVFSYCEHHLALMYDMKVSVGYIPNGKVIGLSKVARIAEMCAKRLQLQERIGTDIYEVLSEILDTENIIVVIEGSHSCMTARGIKNINSRTRTATCRGAFKDDTSLREEFYNLIKE
ncbi:MAG: GTP cyclohydrolase I FolE [Erysipelotrichaceae bacterium]|nr:GTP cyclohydrolase I FolE [Erysipelotrichaceae bacterium]